MLRDPEEVCTRCQCICSSVALICVKGICTPGGTGVEHELDLMPSPSFQEERVLRRCQLLQHLHEARSQGVGTAGWSDAGIIQSPGHVKKTAWEQLGIEPACALAACSLSATVEPRPLSLAAAKTRRACCTISKLALSRHSESEGLTKFQHRAAGARVSARCSENLHGE